MTVRRTEVPLGNRPRKPALDGMGAHVEVPRATPAGPGRPVARPQRPDLDHMGPGTDLEVPLSDKPRPRGRSIAGRPGSDAGKRGRR